MAFNPPITGDDVLAESCPSAHGAEQPRGASLIARLGRRLASDEQLAEQLKGGAADALEILFERHSPIAFAIARRILRDSSQAEDATQQVFLDVFRFIAQFDSEKGSFKSWLLTIVYRRAFNYRRGLRSSRYFEMEPIEECTERPRSAGGRARPAEEQENRILVRQALAALPEKQRRTIELVYFSGLTASEVANATGETVRVVRHNLYRGLEKLRRLLRDKESESTQGVQS